MNGVYVCEQLIVVAIRVSVRQLALSYQFSVCQQESKEV